MRKCSDLPSELLNRRVAVEEIYANGLSHASNHGLDTAELAFINMPEHGGTKAHVYGDSSVDQVLHLFRMLDGQALSSRSAFYDLGSGSGRLTLLVHLFTPAALSVGIELSPTRHMQATAAQHHSRHLIDDQRGLRFIGPSSMLDVELSDATHVYVFNLCFDESFLQRLGERLIAQLPVGASILLYGKQFPPGLPFGRTSSNGGKRLELRLRMMMYYGYRIVAEGRAASASVLRLNLNSKTASLGATRFTRSFLHDPMNDDLAARPLCALAMVHGRTEWLWREWGGSGARVGTPART